MSRTIAINFPSSMLSEMDELAKEEHRTRAELIREAIRRYMFAARNHPNNGMLGNLDVNVVEHKEEWRK